MKDCFTANQYQQYIGRKRLALILSIGILPLILCGAISLGVVRIPLSEIVLILFGLKREGGNAAIILHSRLPQALAAFLAGAGLSITGTAMQAVLRNPLSSPFTLGISSAAAFGAACVVVAGGGQIAAIDSAIMKWGLPSGSIPLGAFASSLLATFFILFLAGKRHVRTETLILTGVALTSFYGAGIMFLQYIATERELAAIVYWTFGDTQRATWPTIYFLLFLVPIGAIWFCSQGWNYNSLSLGEETAQGLGVPVQRLRTWTMLIASFLTSVLVASLGIIGFVGLVVPHLCRLLIGSDNRYVLPISFFLGGGLLLVSDTAARLLLAPRLMPVSLLTALIGAPIFMVLLLRRNGPSC